MFTGLVEETGTVLWIKQQDRGGIRLALAAPELGAKVAIGDSVAVNGCCLTAVTARRGELQFDLLEETLRVTNLGRLRPEKKVNLERALTPDRPMGGHFVQGHVDCTAETLAYAEEGGGDHRLEVSLPAEFRSLVVPRGSITVNGVSLTVARLEPDSLTIWIIPHTHARTNLRDLRAGSKVNLEFDLLAKYVERMLDARLAAGGQIGR